MADVLVVEDEEWLLQTLRYNLTRAGHEVRLCTNGAQASSMVRGKPPDLLLLDLMLPGLDGLEICRAVRAETEQPRRQPRADPDPDRARRRDRQGRRPRSRRRRLPDQAVQHARAAGAGEGAAASRGHGRAAAGRCPLQLASGDLVDRRRRRTARLAAGQPLRSSRASSTCSATSCATRPGCTRASAAAQRLGLRVAGDTRTVDVHVRWLRGKIEPDPALPTRIQTVRGVGYLFSG